MPLYECEKCKLIYHSHGYRKIVRPKVSTRSRTSYDDIYVPCCPACGELTYKRRFDYDGEPEWSD